MPPIQLAERLALLLALAVFLGLAFEEIYKRDQPEVPGGIRTFPLLALAGALLYLVEPGHAIAFCAGLLAMAAWVVIFLRIEPTRPETGRTLVIPAVNLLVYTLGPIVLTQPPWVAIGATVAAVLLIGWREQMHGFVRLVPQDEILTAGKFLSPCRYHFAAAPGRPDYRRSTAHGLSHLARGGRDFRAFLPDLSRPVLSAGERRSSGEWRVAPRDAWGRLLFNSDYRRPRQASARSGRVAP